MNRVVEPELLDELPPDDPRAVRSRRDLRHLNWLMRHADMLHAAVSQLPNAPKHIAELGAGEGLLLLSLARRIHKRWPAVRVTLVDRQKTVSDETLARFYEYGWHAEVVTADVFDWLNSANRVDLTFANLFLHHFSDEKLMQMFWLIAARTDVFIACETRRTLPSKIITQLLWVIGCNSVTRNDAVISINAGFTDRELSALWPANHVWQLEERGAVLFTHLFTARRIQ